MNRNEIKEYYMGMLPYGYETEKAYDFMHISKAIDECFDDFESRTCENCNHYKDEINFGDTKLDCTVNKAGQNIVSFPPPTFGCNKFERKQDV